MNPEDHPAMQKKSSLGLPVGTRVTKYSEHGVEGTIQATFLHPEGSGPQYRVDWYNGTSSESIHQSNVKWLADAPKATAVKAARFQSKDRVKFRHNNKVGTVQDVACNGLVAVKYDGSSDTYWEKAENLGLIYSPAAKVAEGPHPMQSALDAIDEERRKVGLQITALQIRSRELKKAKELLTRGV